jgi:hypothetical protein
MRRLNIYGAILSAWWQRMWCKLTHVIQGVFSDRYLGAKEFYAHVNLSFQKPKLIQLQNYEYLIIYQSENQKYLSKNSLLFFQSKCSVKSLIIIALRGL